MKMLEYDRIDVPEGIDINKTSESKEWYFKDIGMFGIFAIGILKTLVVNFNHIFVMVAMLC